MRGVWLGVLLAAVGCTTAPPPAPPPSVEAIYDVPREYRVLSALPCAEGAGLVYLLTDVGELYSFQPDALELTRIGKLNCPTSLGERPNSMAVDRSGTAWLNYLDGSLYRASTRDASCKPANFAVGQHGFTVFGMAFASTGRDLMQETLFVWGGHAFRFLGQRLHPSERRGRGLARIGRKTLALSPIGRANNILSTRRGELTGTGDGRLFGFFATRPASLARLDPETGEVLSIKRLGDVLTGRAWAFSFWGGDFWFYWAVGRGTSKITRVSGTTGESQQMMDNIGFTIVGAGVSTCAPTK